MIDISIRMDTEPFSLMAAGHAHGPRNEADHDMVCCAVSVIVQTLAISLGKLDCVHTDYSKQSGDIKILVTGTEAHWDELVPRFQMAIDGLTQLAEHHPQCLRLSVIR